MISVTQEARGVGPGADYIAKRIARGDGKTEAVRLLRRRISNAVLAAMLTDERLATCADTEPHTEPALAAA